MPKKRASKRSAFWRKPPWLIRCAASAVMWAGARAASHRVAGTRETRSHLVRVRAEAVRSRARARARVRVRVRVRVGALDVDE